jgi:hypothetical protein
MAQVYYTTILKGRGIVKEANAIATVYPGDLVMLDNAGKAKPHNVAGGKTTVNIARENELFGSGMGVAYASGQLVQYESCYPGMEVNASIAANAAAIVVGDLLESAGDGTFRKRTAASQSGTTPFAYTAAGTVLLVAQEALDNSANAARANLRCEVA